jgi:hypothetical protein
MRFMLLVVAAIAIAASARAHNWWGNGNVVDQATKSLCCGQNDSKEVPAADVIQPGADHRRRPNFCCCMYLPRRQPATKSSLPLQSKLTKRHLHPEVRRAER